MYYNSVIWAFYFLKTMQSCNIHLKIQLGFHSNRPNLSSVMSVFFFECYLRSERLSLFKQLAVLLL